VDGDKRDQRLKKTILITFVLAAANIPFIVVSIRPTVTPAVAQQQMAELWREPTDISSIDLFNGPWGAAASPDPNATYSFVKAKLHGNSPGLTARDSKGIEWSVKQGAEGPIEVTFSRVLSAIGYHQPPVYFLPSFALERGGRVEQAPGGRFRAKHDALAEMGNWSWQQNPFVGTKPYQGLLVLMMILNSTDLKNENNELYEPTGREREQAPRWYVVKDLGASLGETGRMDPRRGDIGSFERERFIRSVDGGLVRFGYRGRHQELLERMRVEDVRWMCDRLQRLTDRQWRDAFRAGNFSDDVTTRYVARIHQKIDEGLRLQ